MVPELDSETLEKLARELESMTPEYRKLFRDALPSLQPAIDNPANAQPVVEARELPREACQPATAVDILPAESVCSDPNALPGEPLPEYVSTAGPSQDSVGCTAEIPQEMAPSPRMGSPAFVFIPPEVSRSEPTTISALRPARSTPASRRSDLLAARHYAFTVAACVATAIATFFGTTAWHDQANVRKAAVSIAAAVPHPDTGVKRAPDIMKDAAHTRQPLPHPDPLAGLDLSLGADLPVEEPTVPAPEGTKNVPISRPDWTFPDSVKPVASKTTSRPKAVRSRRARIRSHRARAVNTRRTRRRSTLRRARRVVGSSVIKPITSR